MFKTNLFKDENKQKKEKQEKKQEVNKHLDLDPVFTQASDIDKIEDSNSNGEVQENAEDEDNVTINKRKVVLMKQLLDGIKESHEKLTNIISVFISNEDEKRISIGQMSDEKFSPTETETSEGRIIEGVFDGENMIGPDGKQYSVPANYASKSKLVEGDILKLTITPTGTFVYKQIGPIERKRIIGKLELDSSGNFYILSDGKKWRALTASVTYFKGQHDDEAVILVPKAGESKWGALENIVKAGKHE